MCYLILFHAYITFFYHSFMHSKRIALFSTILNVYYKYLSIFSHAYIFSGFVPSWWNVIAKVWPCWPQFLILNSIGTSFFDSFLTNIKVLNKIPAFFLSTFKIYFFLKCGKREKKFVKTLNICQKQ